MRTIPFWVAVITSLTLAAHADSFVLSVSGVTSNATKAYTNPVPVSGYIECVKITCDAALTGTVTVAGRDETVLIVATPTAGGTAVYHPMVQACWTNGTAFSASGNTNATRVYISDEQPVLTVLGGTIKPTASGGATVTVKVSPK